MSRRRIIVQLAAVAAIALAPGTPAAAGPVQLSGAIFTTDASGVPVTLNQYAAKGILARVYLNAGV